MKQSYIQNLSQLHHEEPERLLRRCSGFFIVNWEPVYNWVAVSTSDNDQVKASGKDVNIYIYIYVCVCVFMCWDNVTKSKKQIANFCILFNIYI